MVELEVQLLFRVGGGGWSEETKLVLNSTLVKVSVEVGVWQYYESNIVEI